MGSSLDFLTWGVKTSRHGRRGVSRGDAAPSSFLEEDRDAKAAS